MLIIIYANILSKMVMSGDIMLNFGLTGHINLGWPRVDVIAACACSGTGWKQTLGMSIAEMRWGGVTGGVGRVRLMEGEREACLIYSL